MTLARLPLAMFAAAALAAASAAGAASFSTAQYTVTFDDSTPLGTIAFNTLGSADPSGLMDATFGWNVPAAVSSNNADSTFALPSITLTANPGYTLDLPVKLTIGDFAYTEIVPAATSGSVNFDFVVNASTDTNSSTLNKVQQNQLAVGNLVIRSGYLNGNVSFGNVGKASAPFQITSGQLMLSAPPDSTIYPTSQTRLLLDFGVSAVPEPATWGLSLAGLAVLAVVVGGTRRRDDRASA